MYIRIICPSEGGRRGSKASEPPGPVKGVQAIRAIAAQKRNVGQVARASHLSQ